MDRALIERLGSCTAPGVTLEVLDRGGTGQALEAAQFARVQPEEALAAIRDFVAGL